MRSTFIFCCVCLVISFASADVPLPQINDAQDNLVDRCKIPKCPETNVKGQEDTVLLPYPLDCLQYVECKGSEARILPCPPDEVFDQSTSSCGPQEKVRCIPCYQQAP